MSLQHIDLNVWEITYETTNRSEWRIDVYPDMNNHQEPEMIIYLNETQVEMLGLEKRGDDWWTDPVSFLHQHHNMPRKLRRILENLEVTV